jgi:parallel beta-helix repeat protein
MGYWQKHFKLNFNFKLNFKLLTRVCLVLLGGLACAGCLEPGVIIGDATLTDLAITGPGMVHAGETAPFGALATFDDGSTMTMLTDVDWTVTEGPGSVDSIGRYAAPATVDSDTPVTVRAELTWKAVTKEATKSFTLLASSAPQKKLTGLTISGPEAVGPGETAVFTASVLFDDGSTADVTAQVLWSLAGEALGTILEGGSYTAPAVIETEAAVTVHADYVEFSADQAVALTVAGEKKISGQVFDPNGNEVAGVMVVCSYNGQTLVTDGSGYYSFRVPYNWSGTVTPQLALYTFDPSERVYENLKMDLAEQNFTAYTGTPGENRLPTATSQTLSTPADTELTMTLTGSDPDGDAITCSVLAQPIHGSLSGSAPALSYIPEAGYEGSDNFTFKVNDGTGDSTPATITIQVGGAVPPENIIYVDSGISVSESDSYDPASRSTGSGSAKVYKMLTAAANAAQAGDTVLIRGGTYGEKLAPANSGTADSYITFKNYPDETVTITGSSLCPAIAISNRSYLVIEGLTVDYVQRWMYALNTHHTILRGNHFSRTTDAYNSAKTGLFYQEATYNKILNNTIEESTQDGLTLIKSDRNLVEGNTFDTAVHALWTIKGGNYNVVRNNYCSNPDQKIGECYDMEDVGFDHEFNAVKCTHYNLIEGNVFACTRYSSKAHDYNAIQYGAQNGLIRKNVFYNNAGGGLGLQIYREESLYNLDNRIYHNVFYNNNHGGVYLGNGVAMYLSGNLFKNNILYRNYGESGRLTQVRVDNRQGFCFLNNNILYESAGQGVVENAGQAQSLAWYETNYAALFQKNLEVNPKFVNEANHDFRLQSSSPMIDKGTHLTRTVGAGSGKAIKVADAGYFYDGFGIPGEVGDMIQLEGQSQAVRIVSVDFNNHTLTVETSISWSDGQGVSLKYTGNAPDLGSCEFGQQ